MRSRVLVIRVYCDLYLVVDEDAVKLEQIKKYLLSLDLSGYKPVEVVEFEVRVCLTSLFGSCRVLCENVKHV